MSWRRRSARDQTTFCLETGEQERYAWLRHPELVGDVWRAPGPRVRFKVLPWIGPQRRTSLVRSTRRIAYDYDADNQLDRLMLYETQGEPGFRTRWLRDVHLVLA